MSTTEGGGNIITDGLVLYLDAANTKSFVSGNTIWNDLSRGGNNGTLINGPTFNSGNGGSIVFDGVDDYVKGENTFSVLDGGNKLTISMWVKVTSLAVARILFHIPRNTTASNGQVLVFLRTNGQLDITGFSSGAFMRSNTGVITVGEWYHISLCFDLSLTTTQKIRPYVNGIDVFNAANALGTTFPTSTGSIWIGEEANGYQAPFLGNISQVSLYNRRLSESEVLQNYNATKSRFGL